MALSDADRADLQAKLAAANAALHDLMIGGKAQSLGYDGEQVSYTPADETRLRRYIRQIETQLGIRRQARGRGRGVVFGGCR